MRTRHAQFIASTVPFATRNNFLPKIEFPLRGNLLDLLRSSPGAFIAKQSTHTFHDSLCHLDVELNLRFSFQWLVPKKSMPRKLAVLGGRPAFDLARGSYGSKGPFEAAQALGISLIVLDKTGHWLEDDAYAYLRDEFIPIDTTSDATLPTDVANLLKDRNIDGVVTFSDEFVILTAKVAEILNLPSESVRAVLQAHYKDETRASVENPNVEVLRLDGEDAIRDPLMLQRLQALRYPLIIKPCRGCAADTERRAVKIRYAAGDIHRRPRSGREFCVMGRRITLL
jgi:hypothetical protein